MYEKHLHLVGPAPSQHMQREFEETGVMPPAFIGSDSLRRLLARLTVTEDEFCSVVNLTNLSDSAPLTDGKKWAKFNHETLATCAKAMLFELSATQVHHTVFACSRAVIRAFDIGHIRWFERYWATTKVNIVPIPHPGGTNLWWNYPDNVELFDIWARDILEPSIREHLRLRGELHQVQ